MGDRPPVWTYIKNIDPTVANGRSFQQIAVDAGYPYAKVSVNNIGISLSDLIGHDHWYHAADNTLFCTTEEMLTMALVGMRSE